MSRVASNVLTERRETGEAVASSSTPVRWYDPLSSRESLAAGAVLAVVSLLLFLPHLLHGGLYLDDWGDAAIALQPPDGASFGAVLSDFNDLLSSCRPVQILLIPLKYLIFGTHTTYLLALSVGLAFLAAALAYAILRVLGLAWYHALLIAALTLAYPWFDSTRFWESANLITLAVVFAFAGLWLALIGLSLDARRLHVAAAILYLLSMLTYEVTLPFIAAVGILYTAKYGWRAARFRWGLDLLVVAIAGAWSFSHTPRTVSDTSGGFVHFREIVTHGGELLARSLYPLGNQPQTTLVLMVLSVIFGLGVLALLWSRQSRWSKALGGLRIWLGLGLAGVLIASLGWLVFVPGDPYYTPTIFGVSNRINGLAGFGLVLTAYAALGVVGLLVGQLLTNRSWAPAAITLVLAAILGAAYVHVLQRHDHLWKEAFELKSNGIEAIRESFPRLGRHSTIFVSSYPANVTLGVPVFATTWDLDGLAKLTYDDDTIRAFPITDELRLECTRAGMRVGGPDGGVAPAPYGSARLLNLESGDTARPRDRRSCLALRTTYPAGPLYLGTTY